MASHVITGWNPEDAKSWAAGGSAVAQRNLWLSIPALTLAFAMAIFAWRTAVGAVSVMNAGETSMIIGMPLWWTYAAMAPCFALATVAAVALSVKLWRGEVQAGGAA